MYPLKLTESLIEPQQDEAVLETTVGGVLSAVSENHGDATALIEVDLNGQTGRRWNYRQLYEQSEKLALALSSRFDAGEKVCVWSPNTPEWLLMEYACALAGLVLVTANPAYQEKELRYVLEQSGSVGLFLVQGYRGNPMGEIGRAATEGLPAIREVTDLDDTGALLAHGSRAPALPAVHPGDAAQIQYTSGTTGFPKGAVLSHRGLTNNARYYVKRINATRQSRWLGMMPMFHTSGCAMNALGALQANGPLYMVKLFDPGAVARLIEQEKLTIVLGVPTMLVGILESLELQPRDMSSVDIVTSGGSMVAPELVRRIKAVFGCDFETVYGQTETCPLITQHFADDTIDDICNTVGQPMPQTSVSVRSIQENKVVPVDSIGEICVRGYCNMIGYHANEEATARTIDPQGWLHTGDLGAMDERGYLRITGRVKEMIIRGGENLFPAEIENVLLEHPAVAEVAVVGLPDDRWGEIVACFVRAERGQGVTRDELHAHCRAHMSPQKTPVVWCEVSDYPLTGSGKIRKFELRDGFARGQYPEMA